ncbi:MAG: biotin synthase BioB [Candidatus Lambdaproteobacteria bacterium]|nr:biotin synthase BioB [Candidatus Lambdaproteobacteria bacterium]
MTAPRTDWSRQEVAAIYTLPVFELLHRAQSVHRKHFQPGEIQVSTLLSIKTGGCPEDCGYCAQSAHHHTDVKAEKLLPLATVVARARQAQAGGATRFCMGAAWRQARAGGEFEQVLAMVRAVSGLGLETCCTLGMLTEEQARRLKAAGLHAYNHNIDSAEEFYGHVVTTRTYAERLATIAAVRKAGITVCTGGILGMGESEAHRVGLLHRLATFDPQPESVTVNMLVPIKGTPMADQPPVSPIVVARVIATARVLMPRALVRLSAGRTQLSPEAHLLCFYAGANSIFAGERLLTAPNPERDADAKLFENLGLKAMPRDTRTADAGGLGGAAAEG